MFTQKGTNEIKLCKADMMQAIEYWLNEVLLKSPVKVTSISEDSINHSSTYTIEIEKAENSVGECAP